MCKVKEQARAYHIGDGQPVRWYVMLLPSSHRGMATGLKEERERRIKHGESVFDYFAPSYVEVKKMKGKLVKTDRPLLYNYVFIRASVDEIFKLKQYLPQYNFLPKVKGEKEDYYPYLSDKAMENLKWIANSYSNVLPVYIPKAETLVKGDRIRITEGQFKGAEATVVVQPGAGEKDIITFRAGKNAVIRVVHYGGSGIEIYGAYHRANPDRRSFILKKGEKLEWDYSIEFEKL